MTTIPGAAAQRYSTGAILLHWAIAVLIIANIVLGVRMRMAGGPSHGLPTHGSIGLTVLMLSLLRVAWRLTHRPPALPLGMRLWERMLARTVHVGLYVIMLGLPLTGWALASTLAGPPLRLYGLAPWPWFPGLHDLLPTAAHRAGGVAGQMHVWLGRGALALILLHVAGVVKHTLARDSVAWRMLPLPPFRPRQAESAKAPTGA